MRVSLGREGKQQLAFYAERNPHTADMATKLQTDEGQAAEWKLVCLALNLRRMCALNAA